MSLFVGNTLVKTEDVINQYHKVDIYDTTDEENKNLGYVILESDFHNRLGDIHEDVANIIKTLEKYDLSTGIDELKILLEKLY